MIYLIDLISPFLITNSSLVLFVCDGFVALFFVLFVLLSIFKTNFGILKRLSVFSVIIGVFLLENALFSYQINLSNHHIFTLGLYLILSVLFIILPVKKRVVGDDTSKLNKLIDYEINKRDDLDGVFDSSKSVYAESTKKNINIGHIKAIIERLNFYPLSVADKSEVRKLEALLTTAERDNIDSSLESKINESLNSLLKIMSKYGV